MHGLITILCKEYKISKTYLKKIRNNNIHGILIFSFLLLYFSFFVMIDYWHVTLPIAGLVIIPIFAIYRWKSYKKELALSLQCKLEITESSLVYHYANGKTEINCQNPQRLDINLKKGEIDSLLITIDKDNKVLISSYEKLDEIKNHFAKQVGELNVKQHRIFHKLK